MTLECQNSLKGSLFVSGLISRLPFFGHVLDGNEGKKFYSEVCSKTIEEKILFMDLNTFKMTEKAFKNAELANEVSMTDMCNYIIVLIVMFYYWHYPFS